MPENEVKPSPSSNHRPRPQHGGSAHCSPAHTRSPTARGTDRHGTSGQNRPAAKDAADSAEYELTKDVVTSDDVIEFYAKYGQDSPVAFFFCVRYDTLLRFRPYDLLVVRREDVRDEYYTVSATGVTHIRKGMPAGSLLFKRLEMCVLSSFLKR